MTGPKADVQKMLETARERYKRCVEADEENRKRALEAIRFRNLEQWDAKIKADRENDPEGARPCLVLDKTNQHVRQVVNDIRQNRPAIKVRPVDDIADPRTAEIFQGIIRHIESTSNADIAYDTAVEHAVDGGFGYWRILTEYCDEMSFDQDIRIKRVRNRFSVYLGEHQEPDGSDAPYGFVVEKKKRSEFIAEYPDADPVGFKESGEGIVDVWAWEDDILVAEYFRVENERVEIALLADRSVVKSSELPDGAEVLKRRKTKIPTVKWSKITAKEELESSVWVGKTIPIAECVGNELDIEGKRYLSGMIWAAMDPQRMYNYAGSAFAQNVALAPTAPWVIAEGQIEGHENDWKTSNRRNLAALIYKPVMLDTGVQAPLPQRQAPPGLSVGWQAVMQNSEHDIQGSMGMYRESLGEESNAKSGRAIVARQREGDTGSFHYSDNQVRAIRYTGKMLVEAIPKVYDTKRIARILGEDGVEDYAEIDPDLTDDDGNKVAYAERKANDGFIKKIYNLGVGKYDVVVSAGPSYTTKRQEAAEFMTQIAQAQPQLVPIMGDLMFKAIDMPYAEEISERLKKMLPPQLQGKPENGEPSAAALAAQTQQLEQAGQALAAKQQELQQVAQQLAAKEAELQGQEQTVNADKSQLEAQRKILAADAARIKAEIKEAETRLELAVLKASMPQGLQQGSPAMGAPAGM